jgi:hypothetical protein
MAGLFIVGVILVILWIVALITHFVVSAAIHLLLAAAIIMFIVGLVAGRRTTAP